MEYLETDGKRKGFIRRNFDEIEFKQICENTPFIKNTSRKSIRERVFCILNDITCIPKCVMCNSSVPFSKGGKYTKNCSQSCADKNSDKVNNMKKTKLEKYGNEHYTNPEKAIQTCLEKYGVTHTSKLKDYREKCKRTCLERYGHENYNNREKAIETCISKYGVENPAKSREIRDKISIAKAREYQSRLINGHQSGYVYTLQFYSLIKIGVTNHIENRFKQLRKDFGDFSIIEIVYSENCYLLESQLHDLYAENRVCLKNRIF